MSGIAGAYAISIYCNTFGADGLEVGAKNAKKSAFL